MGRLVDVADTRLWVEERGAADAFPLLVFHGGPGLDHTMFGDYLDPLTDDGRYRLVLVDERAQGRSDRNADPSTWTLERMAADVSDLAESLGVPDGYAALGHSYGAFVVLRHAVDFAGEPRGTIVSAGVAAAHWLELVEGELDNFEPEELRAQVAASWEREQSVETDADVAAVIDDQWPFHFRDPRDRRIDDYMSRIGDDSRYSAAVLKHFAAAEYGGIDVVDRLGEVSHPVLVLSGRYDRVCPVDAGAEMAKAMPDAHFVVFEESAHMMFVEEEEFYVDEVRAFLDRITAM
jgi:proline iminopeptidase